jgi:hypothetical protein
MEMTVHSCDVGNPIEITLQSGNILPLKYASHPEPWGKDHSRAGYAPVGSNCEHEPTA